MPSFQPDRDLWIAAIEKYQPFDYHVQTYFICSLHFERSHIKVQARRKTVVPGKLPSIFPNNVATDNIRPDVEVVHDNDTCCVSENNNADVRLFCFRSISIRPRPMNICVRFSTIIYQLQEHYAVG